jgi:hypothetical protein
VRAVGFAFIGGMVAVPFVAPWLERLRFDHRRRVARMIAAAERDGRVAR